MVGGNNEAGQTLFDGPADWISPDNSPGGYRDDGGDPAYTNKVIINDTDHLWGFSDPQYAEDMRKWVWKTFTSGHHPIFMDSYNVYFPPYQTEGIDARFSRVRAAMGHTLTYANKMDLVNVTPQPSLASTGYCLAKAGYEYLVYYPNGGGGTLNLTGISGDFSVKWFNPYSGGSEIDGGTTTGGASRSFTPPFSGDAVLYLKNQVQDTTPPTAVASVRDGASATADSSSTNSTSQLSANWDSAADNESGISNYQYAIGTTAGGTQTLNWTTIGNVTAITKTGLTLTVGTTYYFSIRAISGGGTGLEANSDGQFVGNDAGSGIPLPGKIEAEDYNAGGEGVGYHDTTTGNEGSAYKSDGVDIEATGDTGGGYNIGWVAGGEWLAYDVTVANSGTYNIKLRLASPLTTGRVHVEVDGLNKTGAISVPNTGSYQSYTDVISTISILGGNHELRVVFDVAGENLNYIIVSTGAEIIVPVGSFTNGSFEDNFNNWDLTSSNGGSAAAQIKSDEGASDGAKACAFNAGNAVGNAVLSQTFEGITGSMVFSFDFGVFGLAQPQKIKVEVLTGGATVINEVITKTGTGIFSPAAVAFQGYTYSFTGTGDITLRFTDQTTLADSNSCDGILDNITVGAVNDTTPPGAPSLVRDGTGSDAGSTTLSTTLSANWMAATDDESGIANYQYAIGTAAGGTQVLDWTTIGNVLTITKTGLSLTIGTTYYFGVRAVNGQSLTGTATNSNGQVVISTEVADTTPPGPPGIVRDGPISGTDDSFTYSTTTLSANWTAASDTESSISRYEYAIGTALGATDRTNWTAVGNVLTVTKTGLTLAIGTTYYFSVRAINSFSLTGSAANSNGQYVKIVDPGDITGPIMPSVVRDGLGITDAGSTYDKDRLSVNWNASVDNESGIAKYWYAIGTHPSGTDVTSLVDWTDNGPATFVTRTGLTLTAGVTYYFSVKSENGVGMQSSTATSNGQYVEPTLIEMPPVISNVQVPNIAENSVTITWTTDKLATSQVEYGLTVSYGSLTIEDTGLVTGHSVNLTGLTANKTYHYRVISRDQNGSEKKTGDFTFNTATPPVPPTPNKARPNPVDFHNGQQVTFDIGNAGGEAKIYTLTGKLVKNLAVGSGIAEIQWDGKNEDGQKVVRGIYIYKIKTADGSTTTGKLAVVR